MKEVMIKMEDKKSQANVQDDWVSMAQGSRSLGFNRNYLRDRIRTNNLEKEMLDRGMLLKLGNAKFINSKGIEFVKQHVKKLGVHVNRRSDYVDMYLKTVPLSTLVPAVNIVH